eukprot:6461589-Lingulodinium_polyedra.AAC.1
MRAPVLWRARGARGRAMCEPARQRAVDSLATLRDVFAQRHNVAVESTVCSCSGSRIARPRAPCARQISSVRVNCGA